MAEFNEIYDNLIQEIEKINARVNSLTNQVELLKEQVDRTIPDKIKALKRQLDEIDDYKARVEKIRIGASKHVHTLNNISESPRPLNFNRLRNWYKMIDPDLADDPYAQRVLIMCKCNLMFLAQKREETVKMLASFKSVDTQDADKELDQLEAELNQQWEEYDKLIFSEKMISFVTLIREANEKWIFNKYPDTYSTKTVDGEKLAPGCMAMDLPFPEVKRKLVAEVFRGADGLGGRYYDISTGCVWYPMELEADEEQTVLISYSTSVNTRTVELGIQNMLFRVLNESETGAHKVYFMDALHYNTSMLGALKVLEDTEVLKRIPRNPEQVTEQLKEIIAGFSDYDEIMGLVDSVAEYNRMPSEEKSVDSSKQKEKLERMTLFLVGYPKAFSNEAKDLVQRILINSERYGVTIVCVDTYTEKSGVSYKGIPEYIANRACRIIMNENKHACQFGEDGQIRGYQWYLAPKTLGSKYVEDIKKLTKENSGIGNVYTKHVDLENRKPYTRGNKDLEVKVAVDRRDVPDTINFTNENFAHFLMGASGSGKSTLLHNIITGIIRDYHPDDVELWLADFKMSEFAQYMDPMPPHIKYILLDESQELVYDLIDKLTEKMMERQKYFMVNRDKKKVENVPSNEYMPVILVILDEFSIMSQAVAESENYKLKLQNLLAKGRALGIKFIFSSQTFIKGIAGLTPTAKEQIQTRIAMKNSFDEINETLELSSNTRTDQIRSWMEALPPHYILMKYREADQLKVKRLQVMYFEGKGEAAMEPQRKLIRSLNNSMKSVPLSAYNSGLETYVDKEPVIVDGNSYDKYDQAALDKCIEAYKVSNSKDLIGDEMYMAYGTPRLMVKNKLSVMSNETRENILLIARNTEQSLSMSIILSVMKSAKSQGVDVEVWAYGRNRLFMANKEIFTSGEYQVSEGIDAICERIRAVKESIQNRENSNRMVILVGMDRICADFELISGSDGNNASVSFEPEKSKAMEEVSELKKKGAAITTEIEEKRQAFGQAWIKFKRDRKNELKEAGKSAEEIKEILKAAVSTFEKEFYGDLYDAMKEYVAEKAKAENANAEGAGSESASATSASVASASAESAEGVIAESVNSEDAQKTMNVNEGHSYEGPEPEVTSAPEGETATENKTAESEKPADNTVAEGEKAAENKTTENEEPAEDKTADTTKNASQENSVAESQEDKGSAYAALDDFAYIIKQGSRLGTHFMLIINSFADIKQCGVKPDLFRHKMAFQMSVDDSRNLFGSKIASALPEHICQYDDTYERYSFRPYLHEGIGWDGWTVDEKGNVVNPMA